MANSFNAQIDTKAGNTLSLSVSEGGLYSVGVTGYGGGNGYARLTEEELGSFELFIKAAREAMKPRNSSP